MDLENRLFFRFVRIAYVISLPLFFILLLILLHGGWGEMKAGGIHLDDFPEWISQKDQLKVLFILTVFIFPIYFSLVNLIKETLIYLAFARKFAWKGIDLIGYGMTIMIILAFLVNLIGMPKYDFYNTPNKTIRQK